MSYFFQNKMTLFLENWFKCNI